MAPATAAGTLATAIIMAADDQDSLAEALIIAAETGIPATLRATAHLGTTHHLVAAAVHLAVAAAIQVHQTAAQKAAVLVGAEIK